MAALLRLAARRPVRRQVRKSWNSQIVCAARNSSGAWRASQSALGIIHSADTGPCPAPLTASAGSPVASTASASASAHMSIHRMAGRSGCAAASSATTVQQVVVVQSASTADLSMPDAVTAPRTATAIARHQSSGSCSARAPAPKRVSYDDAADATARPEASNTVARRLSVPPSMPTT